ncbi:YncE family protein [Halothiobacillus sp. DCM-1]|uniref:YncE family protein n=1 Tax=Halothiobacillus sp. DCM-1 TaxID=3112558 RepID=UPI00324C2CB4
MAHYLDRFKVVIREVVTADIMRGLAGAGADHVQRSIGSFACSLLLAALLLSSLIASPVCAADAVQRVTDITLPGPTGRFDYVALDAVHDRLLINQMDAGRVLVFDLHSRKLVGQVAGLQSPTGITVAPQLGLAFVSDPGGTLDKVWGDGTVDAIDTATLRLVRRFAAAGFPDGSAWVPGIARLFVSNERGGKETVIGGTPLRVEGNIHLGGEAGNSAYDASADRVLVNVQARNQIVAIDPRTLAITRRVDLPATCAHNHGLLVDDADRLAFVACDGNARLLSLRLPNLTPVDLHRLGRDPDVLALDAARHRLWVASESGVVSVFAVTPDGLRTLWRGSVGPDAHSLAIDPATGWAWFPLEDEGGQPMLRAMQFTSG